MRRTVSAALVALLAAALLVGGATPATAAEPLPPGVTPIPDLPSNTVRMSPSVTGTWKATDIWKAQLWYASTATSKDLATIPATGTKIAVPPKPITAPVSLARGAAGGPLVGSFMAGFAIGQAGLQVYGMATGNDPLQGVCGSPFEGVSSFLYMGMMPDCTTTVLQPNADVVGTLTASTYNGWSIGFQGTKTVSVSGIPRTAHCYLYTGPATLPTGVQLVKLDTNGTTYTVLNPPVMDPPTSWQNQPCKVSGHHHYPSTLTFGDPNKTVFWRTPAGTQLGVKGGETVQADPTRTPKCTIGWEDGTTTTATGTPYKESVGIPLSSKGLGCEQAYVSKPGAGPDLLPDTIGIESTDEGGAITQIATAPVPDMSPEQRKGLTAPANGRGLVLEKTVDGTSTSCNTWEASCVGWWTETNEGTTTGTYRCTYGGEAVSLIECGPYRNTFEQPTSTPTITDPNGTPQPWPSTTAPAVGSVAGSVTGGGACGASWSWNPVDWVLNPIKCAFIPSEASVITAQTTVTQGWSNTGPAKIATVLTGMAFVTPGSGCGGIVVDIPWFGHDLGEHRLLNACPGDPLHPIATGVSWVVGILAALGAIFAITRAFGFIVGARGVGEGA